ncbi:MAG: FkbM family methyltransferase [Phenylobacterium sp.]
MDQDKLLAALGSIRQRPAWREALVRHLLAFEKDIATLGIDIREDVTGPIVDAVYEEGEPLRKALSGGAQFEFLYRSKIARDLVMSEPATPDHAWEPMTSRIVVDLARGAQQVVVGGAYFGDHAVLIAREIAKNGGLVHAFEPNSDQRRMLTRNAELNGLSNVVARPEGLWSSSSEHLKLVGYDSFATAEKVEAGADDAFTTVTIADYLAGQGVDRLDLIVVDIEGAEFAALQGGEGFLKRPAGEAPHIVFEVHRHYVDWSNGLRDTEISRYLTGLGYELFALRDFNSNVDLAGKPIELIPQDKVYLEGPPHGFNMVAVKDVAVFRNDRYRIVENVSPKLLRHKDPALHHPVGGL